MSNRDASDAALEQVDLRRRGFLGKLLTGSAAVVALPAMSTVVFGQEEGPREGKGKGKGGKGKGDGRNPEKMAADWIKRFDKDGDSALNQAELEEALKGLFQRLGAGKGKGKGGKGKGKGKGKGDN